MQKKGRRVSTDAKIYRMLYEQKAFVPEFQNFDL